MGIGARDKGTVNNCMRTGIWAGLATILLWTLGPAGQAEQADDILAKDPLPAAVEQFREALAHWTPEHLDEAHGRLAGLAEAQPNRLETRYWRAVADLHRVLYRLRAHQSDPEQPPPTLERIDSALTAVRSLLEQAPDHDEGHAMKMTLLGLRVSAARLGMMRHGRAFLAYARQADEHGQANPRAQFLIGSAILYGPNFLGGKDQALEHLQRAASLFEQEAQRTDRPAIAPRWGAAPCWANIGAIHAARGDYDQAAKAWEKALALHPGEAMALKNLRGLREGD